MQNNEKLKEKQQLDGRGYKRIQSKSLESKGYSESIVSERLHQNSDLEVRNIGSFFFFLSMFYLVLFSIYIFNCFYLVP